MTEVAMDGTDPRQLLARRLRALREDHWPDIKITQPQLARALGGPKPLSVPLISSWESQANPKIPPSPRLEAYAALFATPRSFEGEVPRLISPQEMTDEERRTMNEIKQELLHLRSNAMGAGHIGGPMGGGLVAAARFSEVSESINAGPWRFDDGNNITVVCAQFPPDMLSQIPYTDINDPDYIELLTYSELDSLVELYGHLRAANPATQVHFRKADRLSPDEYTSHLVSLGGADWNKATLSALLGLQLPVQQVADWDTTDGQFFEVKDGGRTVQHRAVLDKAAGEKKVLREDVALFARAASPFNKKRTVTICSGMYGRGTYGAVRALTDARFRDRNAEYVESRFGGSESFCILTRVQVVNGATITPDWTIDDNRLFEWSAGADV
jgi:hypothetical protein